MLHLNVAEQLTLSSCTNELSPTSEKDAVENMPFPFDNDLTKYIKNKKTEKHDIQFLQQNM